jgi:large subunit ribosomal protein L4
MKPKGKVYNQEGKEIREIDLPEGVFGLGFNDDLVHQVFVAQYANEREPWAHTKIREEVSGGGKKPWKQKGTGRARHGSIRSPIWRGGGITFGPRNEKNYSQKVNKKMKKKALFMVMSKKNNEGMAAFVDKIELGEAKTKKLNEIMINFVQKVYSIHLPKKVTGKKLMIVEGKKNRELERVSKNIPWLHVITADSLNVGDLVTYKFVLFMESAAGTVEKTFLKKETAK